MSFLTKPYYRTRVLIKLGYYDSLSDEELFEEGISQVYGIPFRSRKSKNFQRKVTMA